MRLRVLLAALGIAVSTGCATVVVDRTQGVAAAGKAYVETLKQVNELALDKSISFSAHVLTVGARNDDTLKATTQSIQQRAALIGQAHEYFDRLAVYFLALEALSKGDPSDATSAAVGELAESLKKEPVGLSISDEKKAALSGLAGYVAKQIHAAAVEKALKRDADTIARALALSEQMLDEQIRWISARERFERERNYEQKVRRPFLAAGALDAGWKTAWTDHVRVPPVIALLTEAKKASKEMQQSWIHTLQGQYSAAEILASLQNVKAGIEALSAVKDAK